MNRKWGRRGAALAVAGLLGISYLPQAMAEDGQELTASADKVAAGESVTISGGHCISLVEDKLSSVEIAVNGVDNEPVTDVSPAGVWSTSLIMGDGDLELVITATCQQNGGSFAYAPLTIERESVPIDVELVGDQGPFLPGDTLNFAGSGYLPGEKVQALIAAGNDGGMEPDPIVVTATDTGAFSGSITLPDDLAPGEYQVQTQGLTSQWLAEVSFEVVAPDDDSPATVTITNKGPIHRGDTLTFTGAGFEPGEDVLVFVLDDGEETAEDYVDKDGNPIPGRAVVVTADDDGDISGTFKVPTSLALGERLLVAIGGESEYWADVEFDLVAAAKPSSKPTNTNKPSKPRLPRTGV